EALLLFFGAGAQDVRDAQSVVRRQRQRDARTDARDLLDADAVIERAHAGAAVGLGDLNAHQPQVRQLFDQLERKMLRLVPLHDVRPNLGLGKFADAASEELLFGRETEIHGSDYKRNQQAQSIFLIVPDRVPATAAWRPSPWRPAWGARSGCRTSRRP